MACSERLFCQDAAEIFPQTSAFSENFNGERSMAKAALKGSIYHISAQTMMEHAAEM